MKWLLVLSLVTSPVFAKDVTITLTDADQNALGQIIDLALKSGGIQALQNVNTLVAKVQSAERSSPAPTPTDPPK